MELYIELRILNDGAKSAKSVGQRIVVDNIKSIKDTVISFFIENYTWATLSAYRIYCRIDGNSDNIDTKTTNLVNVQAKQIMYTKDCKNILWSKDAIIY